MDKNNNQYVKREKSINIFHKYNIIINKESLHIGENC